MQRKRLAVGVSLVMLFAVMGMAQQPPQDKSKRPSPPGHGRGDAEEQEDHHG
jgi:hypothetical protein